MIPFDDYAIRLSIFLGVLLLCAVIEAVLPCKQRACKRSQRWFVNIGLIIIDSITVRLMGQVTALSTAVYVSAHGWGFLNLIQWPLWCEVLLAVLLLDAAIYAQHVASHKLSILWRFHRVHHTDRDLDVTTGTRFHPIEIVFSMLYKCAVVMLLGPAALAVLLFEVILNASAMFNHANIKLPLIVDRNVRLLVVTPDMHRVHHSVISYETDSNYGFFLSIWDRLFKTYIDQPTDGHEAMSIGLSEHQTEQPSSFLWCLLLPFRK